MSMQLADRTNSSSSGLLSHIADQLLASIKEIQARHALRQSLGKISDRHLKDAGLIRHDLDATCAKGLSDPAAIELDGIARRRAGNW